jgi:hypothetical protein
VLSFRIWTIPLIFVIKQCSSNIEMYGVWSVWMMKADQTYRHSRILLTISMSYFCWTKKRTRSLGFRIWNCKTVYDFYLIFCFHLPWLYWIIKYHLFCIGNWEKKICLNFEVVSYPKLWKQKTRGYSYKNRK